MKERISQKVIAGLILEIGTILFFLLCIIFKNSILLLIAFPLLLFGGVIGLALSSIVRKEIKKGKLLIGNWLTRVGLILGIGMIIGFFGFWIIPSGIGYHKRHREASTKYNMQIVAIAMNNFAHLNNDIYPCSMEAITKDGEHFSALLSEELTNPYTKEPTNLKFMGKEMSFPSQDDDINTPPGDIYIYSNGHQYMILGGGEDGKALSLRLTNRE